MDALQLARSEILALQAEKAELLVALRLTEDNLSRLIAVRHSDEVLMTPWCDAVRAAVAKAIRGQS